MEINSLTIEAYPSEEYILTILKEKLTIKKDEIIFERIPKEEHFSDAVCWSIRSYLFVSLVNGYINKFIVKIMDGNMIITSTNMPTYEITVNFEDNSTDRVIHYGLNQYVLNLFRLVDRGFNEVLRGKLIDYHGYEI